MTQSPPPQEQECCEKCNINTAPFSNKYGRVPNKNGCINPNCICHQTKQKNTSHTMCPNCRKAVGLDCICPQPPKSEVGDWVEEYNAILHRETDCDGRDCIQYIELPCYKIQSFLRTQIDKAKEEAVREGYNQGITDLVSEMSHESSCGIFTDKADCDCWIIELMKGYDKLLSPNPKEK